METITVKEILSTKVTLLNKENGYDKIGEVVPLVAAIYSLPNMLKQKFIDILNMEYHSNEQKEAKRNIPRYYISGEYKLDDWKNGGRFPIYGHPFVGSNLMTIDIDAKDNTHVDILEIRKKIFNLPYVFSCLKSVSGKGFYCIIPIEDTLSTKEYYNYIVELWKQQFDINIDTNAASLVRARICSFDEEFEQWIKKDPVKIWKLKKIVKEEPEVITPEIVYPKYEPKSDELNWDFITNKAMELVINNGYKIESYGAWYHLGCELKNFQNGEQMFIEVSKNNPKYNDSISVILKKYNSCKPTGLNDNLRKKWIGMANNRFGKKWFVKYLNNDPKLF